MKQTILNELKKHIDNADIKIFTNDEKYFNAIIISDVFENKELIDRQRLIYDIIGQYITNNSIHAISFKTYTKNEWENEDKN